MTEKRRVYPCSPECENREIGCHGWCEKYKAAASAEKERKQQIQEYKQKYIYNPRHSLALGRDAMKKEYYKRSNERRKRNGH